MKTVTIYRLRLEHFKCHEWLELTPLGQDLQLQGGNGTGKTAVREAVTWLLYGRPETVQPWDAADEVTAVECEFRNDGRALTLRRALQTRWTMELGNPEPVRAGQSTRFEMNGAPVGRRTFEAFVEAWIPERVFRLLSEPGYFTGHLPWPEQRARLLEAAEADSQRETLVRNLAVQEQELLTLRSDHGVRLGECRRLMEDMKQLDCPAGFAAAEKRAEELRAGAARAAARLLEIHQQRQALERISREALDAAQQRLNSQLETVQVQLYRTESGRLRAQCLLTVQGTPLKQAGTGACLRASVELRALLARHFGIRLPLFLDDAQLLTEPVDPDGQCIAMTAAAGPLRVSGMEGGMLKRYVNH